MMENAKILCELDRLRLVGQGCVFQSCLSKFHELRLKGSVVNVADMHMTDTAVAHNLI